MALIGNGESLSVANKIDISLERLHREQGRVRWEFPLRILIVRALLPFSIGKVFPGILKAFLFGWIELGKIRDSAP